MPLASRWVEHRLAASAGSTVSRIDSPRPELREPAGIFSQSIYFKRESLAA